MVGTHQKIKSKEAAKREKPLTLTKKLSQKVRRGFVWVKLCIKLGITRVKSLIALEVCVHLFL